MTGYIKLADPETVLRIYYANAELGSPEIRELFGDISPATIVKLKRKARTLMRERGVGHFNYYSVNTEVAFEAWGINVEKVERMYKRAKALGLVARDGKNAADAGTSTAQGQKAQ